MQSPIIAFEKYKLDFLRNNLTEYNKKEKETENNKS
jgi:hypothetical protein